MANHYKKQKERLAVSMFIDIVGYSELAGKDEYLCLQLLGEYREIVRRHLKIHKGREIDTIGDGFFIEFTSARDAVNCAISMQSAFHKRNLEVPAELLLEIRVGIHLGEVIELENSIFGDSVNIASRIEGIANPAGICISEEVYQQVHGKVSAQFEKRKPVQLKNIKDKKTVYDVVKNWTPQERKIREKKSLERFMTSFSRIPGSKNLDSAILMLQICFSVCILAGVLYSGLKLTKSSQQRFSRSIASGSLETKKIDLSEGWHYQIGNLTDPWKETDSKQSWFPFSSPKGFVWNSNDPGEYWLKKEFSLEVGNQFFYPSIILGHISDESQVFLNGQYIGGSDFRKQVTQFDFDQSLLHEGLNTLYIKGYTQPRIRAGLQVLPDVGAFLSEKGQVNKAANSYWYNFHVLPFAYLAIVMISALCCCFVFVKDPSNKHALYFSLFMLIGISTLSQSNLYIAQNLDGSGEFFLQLVTYMLGSSILFSAFLAENFWNISEAINNSLALLVCGLFGYFAFSGSYSPQSISDIHNLSLALMFGYTVAWFGYVSWFIMKKSWLSFMSKTKSKLTVRPNAEVYLYIIFGSIMLLAMVESLSWFGLLAVKQSAGYSYWVRHLKMFYPVFFALALVTTMMIRYVRMKKDKTDIEKRDNEIKRLAHNIGSHRSLMSAVENIMRSTAKFVQAERSTLYLLCNEEADEKTYLRLTASYVENTNEREFIKPQVFLGQGILDYVYHSRVPFFTNNITKEHRFSSFLNEGKTTSYKTTGCIVVPLIISGRFEGVLTFADKKNAKPFLLYDFEYVRLVGLNLGLISSVNRLENLNAEVTGKDKAS